MLEIHDRAHLGNSSLNHFKLDTTRRLPQPGECAEDKEWVKDSAEKRLVVREDGSGCDRQVVAARKEVRSYCRRQQERPVLADRVTYIAANERNPALAWPFA